jgi:hypothetical protein
MTEVEELLGNNMDFIDSERGEHIFKFSETRLKNFLKKTRFWL